MMMIMMMIMPVGSVRDTTLSDSISMERVSVSGLDPLF